MSKKLQLFTTVTFFSICAAFLAPPFVSTIQTEFSQFDGVLLIAVVAAFIATILLVVGAFIGEL